MSYFRSPLLAIALYVALTAGGAEPVAAAKAVLASHLQQAGNISIVYGATGNVIKVQKTGDRVRRNARPNKPRVRRSKPQGFKVDRPNKPRVRNKARPNKPRTRKLARPDKPRLRRDVRPGKRRARRIAKPEKPRVGTDKRRRTKHRRRKRSVYIYGGYAPYYYGFPGYSYYTPRRYGQYGGRCAYWKRQCIAEWGYLNRDYHGCMRYHRCD